MKKAILIILDGWGLGKNDKSNAIYSANTPYWDSLINNYPNSALDTYGEFVGLPDGQMGNSEVGHLNIGAGRVVYQDLVRINKSIEDNSISENEKLNEAFDYAKKHNKKIHLLGLVSNGGVHSSEKHLYKLCDIAKEKGFEDLYIHALTDGRDCDPYSGKGFIKELDEYLQHSAGKIATICGRYYTMDRDKRWERVKLGYDLMIHNTGNKFTNPVEAMQSSYDDKISDEFIKPIVMTDNNGIPLAKIEKDDVVLCFNFRTDRLREITTVLTQQDFPEFEMKTIPLKYYTMTQYSKEFENVNLIFGKVDVKMTFGEYLSDLNKTQLRIAETEKFPHITFFFSGGKEDKFKGEDRILINSPKVATYDLQPEMSAYLVTEKIEKAINSKKYDFICLNYANGDMVGHTGIYDAIIQACEAVDDCLSKTVETAKANDYDVLIIADHGNADFTTNADGSPNTAHSVGKVPCVYVGNQFTSIQDGILADVAPTLCKIMDLSIPKEMTGKILF